MPPILMRMGNARAHITYLIASHLNFILTSSNYTTAVETEYSKDKYVQTMQSNRTFACFAKLKKDLKDKKIPNVTREEVRYFQHDFKKNAKYEKVYNIDIKSAYATILYIDGFITKDTFEYIQKCSKQERLASVGMLASRKKIFQFKKGLPITEEEVISEKSGLFFYAVKRTFEIMDELKRICGSNYLYTWVDGIYFLPCDRIKKECISLLEDNSFKCSFDVLSKFEINIKTDHTIVTFKKDDKKKIFNLPSQITEFKRIMIDAVQNISKSKIKKQCSEC